MDITAALQPLRDSLAQEDGVFGGVERAEAGSVAEHVHALVLEAQYAWAPYALADPQGPPSPSEVVTALKRITDDEAVAVMTELSAGDPVFPGRTRRDTALARRAAERVTRLLGPDAAWWTNLALTDVGRQWNPVTRHTFDGVLCCRRDQEKCSRAAPYLARLW
jgi:hypothetical protein